jgi:hypothetical protein
MTSELFDEAGNHKNQALEEADQGVYLFAASNAALHCPES